MDKIIKIIAEELNIKRKENSVQLLKYYDKKSKFRRIKINL